MTPRVLAALVTALMILAAGCSDDEPAAEPVSTASPVPETPTPTPVPTVTPTPTPEPESTETAAPTSSPSPQPTAQPAPEPTPAATPTPYDGPPRTYAEAEALFPAGAPRQELSRFASPNGNLYCVLDSPYLPPACELGRGAIPDAGACPDDGPSQNVGRIEFEASGPQAICNSDTIREPDAPTLGFSGIATWPDTTVTCVLKSFGITCIDPASGRGYFLGKGRYQLF
ncbi:hypothetical protein [Nocardioides sp.]|uniref:hypothetical protein n=1 Tax=Nocardioides sp. TaxID=35761 RepID=UPI002B275965|nr:hypothetical protein [Nocardioides sp.]